MQIRNYPLLLFLCCLACNTTKEEKSGTADSVVIAEIEFDKTKWSMKDGEDYPYRDRMLTNLVNNDTVKTLGKADLLELLGQPDRIDSGYLFYMIEQKRLGFWPLHTKTMVVNFSNDSTISWIKIHE